MTSFVQATAEYTNAVLAVILPFVSDFAAKLTLPVQTPVTSRQVKRFLCDPRKGHAEGSIFLLNGFHFAFVDGVISGFWDESNSWQCLDNENRLPQFFGDPKITSNQAVSLARATIEQLGYSESDFYAEADPVIGMPFRYGDNTVPFYTVQWADAQGSAVPTNETYECSARIEIDGLHKTVTSLHFSTRTIRRAQPKVELEASDLAAGKSPAEAIASPLADAMKPQASVTHVTAQQRSKLLSEAVHRIDGFERTLGVQSNGRLSTTDVVDLDVNGYPDRVVVTLKDGALFVLTHGYISWYRGPHAFFGGYLDQPVKKYWGEWKISPIEAITLARNALSKAGCPKECVHYDEEPVLRRTLQVGVHSIPRYQLVWIRAAQIDSQNMVDCRAQVEVDASDGTIKSIGIEGNNGSRFITEP